MFFVDEVSTVGDNHDEGEHVECCEEGGWIGNISFEGSCAEDEGDGGDLCAKNGC